MSGKKVTLGTPGLYGRGFLACKTSGDKLICNTCRAFDYDGNYVEERFVGTYTTIDISSENQINASPGKDGTVLLFGLPVECEEPPIVDAAYVKKGTKILSCREPNYIAIRVQEMTKKGEISERVAHYLMEGEFPE